MSKLEPIVAFVHKELVHSSQSSDDIDLAVAKLVQPYASYDKNEMPAMRDVYLAPNVDIAPETGALTGYVATVMGSAPAAGVVTSALGTGTSWYRVLSKDGDKLRKIEDDDLERIFKPIDTLPAGVRVSIVSGMEYPSIVHYAVVHGNDVVAAEAFADKVAGSSATLDDVMTGPYASAYTDVIARSHEARRQAAVAFIEAHGLALDEKVPESNVVSHFMLRSAPLSEAAHSSLVGPKNVFLVYAGVADTSEAHSGVMMYRGPIAGYTLFTGPTKTVKTRASVAWSNADLSAASATKHRPFSMLPVDTGRFLGKATQRTADRHKGTNATIANVHQRRVKTSGAVRSYNPLADVVMHAPNDPHLISSLTALGMPPGGLVTSQILDVVVTQVPALETRDMSLDELVYVASRATEKTLPVATQSFLRMLANWPLAGEKKLSEVFASQHDDVVDVNVDMLQAMAKHAAAAAAVTTPTTLDYAE